MNNKNWDWKGPTVKKFRWSKFRAEYGRYCYQVDKFGDVSNYKWEWENV